MARSKQSASSARRATLIGDVVGSRRVADRSAAHRELNRALADVAAHAIDPPAFTVGDEFQGSYPTVGSAIDAALSVRLAVAPDIDVRFGIGWGAVTVLDVSAGIQDGPGWWAAREAIEWTAAAQRQPGSGAGAHVVSGQPTPRRRRRDQRRPDVSGPSDWIAR